MSACMYVQACLWVYVLIHAKLNQSRSAKGRASYGTICLHHPPPRWHLLRSQHTYPIFDEQSQIALTFQSQHPLTGTFGRATYNSSRISKDDILNDILVEQGSAGPTCPTWQETSGSVWPLIRIVKWLPPVFTTSFVRRSASVQDSHAVRTSDDKAGQAKAQTHESSGEHDACWEVFGLCLRLACLALSHTCSQIDKGLNETCRSIRWDHAHLWEHSL